MSEFRAGTVPSVSEASEKLSRAQAATLGRPSDDARGARRRGRRGTGSEDSADVGGIGGGDRDSDSLEPKR